ncbi:MAG: hypothetical protein CMO81_00785 [Waddliaceae bacterium]|nr:hypothetical protein [Waddliaceae bacterium]
MRTSNPTLNDQVFLREPRSYAHTDQVMSLEGTVNKSFILLGILLLTAGWTWFQFFASYNPMSVRGLMMVGGFGGFGVALVTVFKRDWSAYTAPIYSALQGLFIGGLSALFEAQYPGIVIQATSLTFATAASMLISYKMGWIQVSDQFRRGLMIATGAIALVYFVNIIMTLFGSGMPFIHSSGPMGIVFSLVVVGIAALNLLLDFDFIARGSRARLPKYMEWYAAFGLMVTLIWLYIEILRLLAKLRDRR